MSQEWIGTGFARSHMFYLLPYMRFGRQFAAHPFRKFYWLDCGVFVWYARVWWHWGKDKS